MIARSLFWLTLTLFSPGLLGAQATAFRSSAAGTGDVWVYPTAGHPGNRPPELQGIVLLPVDATGRTSYTQFQPDQARLKNDLPQASRLLLPQENGSLYRYQRARPDGADFGYFVVQPNGLARFLVAFPGTGGSGTVDPIPDPVAVSSDGTALLIATTPAAGGNLFEIELESATVLPLTEGMPPLNVLQQGLILRPHWGVALTNKGPFRFVRGGGQPLLVPLEPRIKRGRLGQNPGTPVAAPLNYFGNGMVGSADGSTVAVIAGATPSQAHVYTFGLAGPAVCVNDNPASIADPGFGTEIGPALALSPDGRRAAWKTIGASGEVFSRRVSALPTPPEFHITGDLNFADTLNDTGVIAFFDPDSVVVIVGEVNGAGGVEKGDLYRTRFSAGGGAPTFTNLTNTSGDAAAPFLTKGTLETSDGIFQIPEQSGSVYFISGSSGQGNLFRLNGTSGAVNLVRSGVDGLDFIERAGSNFVLGILHDQPVQRELVRIPFDHALPTASLGLFPSSSTFAAHAGNLAGTFAGTVNVTGGQKIFQTFLPTGAGGLWPELLQCGPVLGFDGNGAVLNSIQSAATIYFTAWTLGGSGILYGSGPLASFVLPAH